MCGINKIFQQFFRRGEFGQKFWADAEGRKLILGRPRAAAVGRFFKKFSSKDLIKLQFKIIYKLQGPTERCTKPRIYKAMKS